MTIRIDTRWDKGKLRRFVAAWNDDVYLEGLKERFACKNPAAMAAWLRKRGMDLKVRRGSNEW